jgi:uncharacterized coiled-coil DUF342 family protein
MATLRETIQAEIDGYKAKITELTEKLADMDDTVQSVLGKEYAELKVLVTKFKEYFTDAAKP